MLRHNTVFIRCYNVGPKYMKLCGILWAVLGVPADSGLFSCSPAMCPSLSVRSHMPAHKWLLLALLPMSVCQDLGGDLWRNTAKHCLPFIILSNFMEMLTWPLIPVSGLIHAAVVSSAVFVDEFSMSATFYTPRDRIGEGRIEIDWGAVVGKSSHFTFSGCSKIYSFSFLSFNNPLVLFKQYCSLSVF